MWMENFPTGLSNRFVPSSSRQMLSWIYWNERHIEHVKENKNVIYRYLLIFIVELPADWEKYDTLANLSTCCSQICQNMHLIISHDLRFNAKKKTLRSSSVIVSEMSSNKKQCMLFFLITPCCLRSDVEKRPQSRWIVNPLTALTPSEICRLHQKGLVDWSKNPSNPSNPNHYFCVYSCYNLL